MLVKARLEEIDRVETALRITEELLVVLGGCRGSVLARRGESPGSVGGREMQLVERDQDCLRQIEGSMLRGWDGDDDVGAVEDLVRKSLVLPPEQKRNRAGAGEAEQLGAGRAGRRDFALGSSPPGSEAGDAHAPFQRLLDRLAVPDALDDVAGVVRDSLEAPGIVFHRADEVQVAAPHVLHRANGRGDVDGVLRLVEDDSNRGKNRLVGGTRAGPVSGASHGARYEMPPSSSASSQNVEGGIAPQQPRRRGR